MSKTLTPADTVFATGVHLQPIQVEIDGKPCWVWIAWSFEDTTYYDGKPINVNTHSASFEGLVRVED
jgi:hypothetical protein